MGAIMQKLFENLGVFSFAVLAAYVVWKGFQKMLTKAFSLLEEQNKASQALANRQSEIFAKAIDKRDAQMDDIVTHLNEQTHSLKQLVEATGRIETRVAPR